MEKSLLLDELMRLDALDRLEIADKLWDSVHPPGSARPGDIVVITEEQLAELDRRIEEHKKDPSSAVPLEEAMERLRSRYK
jgi:putative addiction module component (TIGR02574 family)